MNRDKILMKIMTEIIGSSNYSLHKIFVLRKNVEKLKQKL